jgi:hypothetical protein
MTVVKPIVRIKDAFLQRSVVWSDANTKQCYVLIGTVLDYPEQHMAFPGCVENHQQVQTSEVLEVKGDIVITARTEYHVQNWLTEPTFQTTLAAHFGKEGLTSY